MFEIELSAPSERRAYQVSRIGVNRSRPVDFCSINGVNDCHISALCRD